ncbi:MAG: hypothetical protein LLG00_14175 [Planctomycetaceae bacterium]|nr:hypothetical protein [Planctomycetaceae bacterium]
MHHRRSFLSKLAATAAIGVGGFAALRRASAEREDGADLVAGASFVQPDYAAWQKIKNNMTEAEVVRVLGEPLEREKPSADPIAADPSTHRLYRWTYGRLDFKSPRVPDTDYFEIYFDKGRVSHKCDPFGGQLSTDGTPTVPRLIYPTSGASYDHYPRYVDARWCPSSGQYPMHYTVETQFGNGGPRMQNGRHVADPVVWEPHSIATARADVPYHLIVHGGKNSGRWRVKAINARGESEWSPYREFTFRV